MKNFFLWENGHVSDNEILAEAQLYSQRVHTALVSFINGHMSLYDLRRTYYECVQAKGLLQLSLHRLVLTLWPKREVVNPFINGWYGDFVKLAYAEYERYGFDGMKRWMEIQLF